VVQDGSGDVGILAIWHEIRQGSDAVSYKGQRLSGMRCARGAVHHTLYTCMTVMFVCVRNLVWGLLFGVQNDEIQSYCFRLARQRADWRDKEHSRV